MKKIILLLLLLSTSVSGNAQTTPDGSAPQFLYPDFSRGKVKMKNGQFQSAIINYNTVSEKMVYQKEDNLYDMVNTEMMDTVFLQDRKFVPAGKVFYEVLLAAPVSFFVQYKGKLMSAGTQAGYGEPSQVSNTKMMTSVQLSQGYYNLKLPTDYTVKVDLVYWLRKDSAMSSFINEKQFLKIFPGEAADLKQYIKQNRLKFSNVDDMIILTKHLNEKYR